MKTSTCTVLSILSICAGSIFGVNIISEVRSGGNITLSCSNISKETTQVDWFRVENETKARCISSMIGSDDEPSYCSGFKHSRFQMSISKTHVFLTIYQVQTSDSGLYFCGFFIRSNVVIGESTYLSVDGDEGDLVTIIPVDEKMDCPSVYTVLIILGSITVFSILIITGLSVKIFHLQRAKDQTPDSRENCTGTARVFMATTVRSRLPRKPEDTHVVCTVIK
ncbi:uncharacterized protein LOC110168518 [Boleophthalmus pectinirostris]|uniref:uncharacterized protein LOC110168518 n=1 Tax=Boleophthalmus pectinirostris TaxID=150288 RepID=UPI00242A6287|nr:uncharacterized protein LOC110168518 [Boleophthalmus pectinirostris]